MSGLIQKLCTSRKLPVPPCFALVTGSAESYWGNRISLNVVHSWKTSKQALSEHLGFVAPVQETLLGTIMGFSSLFFSERLRIKSQPLQWVHCAPSDDSLFHYGAASLLVNTKMCSSYISHKERNLVCQTHLGFMNIAVTSQVSQQGHTGSQWVNVKKQLQTLVMHSTQLFQLSAPPSYPLISVIWKQTLQQTACQSQCWSHLHRGIIFHFYNGNMASLH